jgi:hypothetical protein
VRASARGALALALLLAAAGPLAGCAKRMPPSGGPPDIEPPRVIGSVPDSGAARVPRDARLTVTFSEGMDARSTGDAVALAPRVEIRQRRWSGRTLTVVLAETLKAHQTYTLFLGSGARDRHGNNLQNGAAVVFSTADSFPHGRLEGEIEARGFPAPGTYLWCYDAGSGRMPDSTARDFDALGLADKLGHFRVDGLPVPGRYRLWAFADLNSNRSFEPETDVLAPVDTVLTLTPDRPTALGLKIRVTNPRAVGRIHGTVVDTLGDSLGVIRLLASGRRDSTRTLLIETDGSGGFTASLPPDHYRIRAFRDHDRNRIWSATEAASELLEIEVPPASEVTGLELVLRRPAPKP